MAGRNPGSKNYQLPQPVLDALLSLWTSQEQEYPFTAIHNWLVEKGIAAEKNKMTTLRILRRAVRLGILTRSEGKYRLNIVPDVAAQLFDQLQSLRKNGGVTLYRAGACYGTEPVNLYMLGAPDHILENPDYKLVLEILLHRISHIFGAVLTLFGLPPDADGKIPLETQRQLLLELAPYLLEHNARLNQQELKEAVDELLKTITAKKLLINEDKVAALRQQIESFKTADVVWPREAAVALTPPEGEEERIKRDIVLTINAERHKNPLAVADALLPYYEEYPDLVRLMLLKSGLNKEKLKEVQDSLEKMALANRAGRLIMQYLDDRRKKDAIARELQQIAEKIGPRTLVQYLQIVDWGPPLVASWVKPILELLPQLSPEEVKKWEEEGRLKYEQIILSRRSP